MRVHDDNLDIDATHALEPLAGDILKHFRRGEVSRAGIEQQPPLPAEYEIKERLFVIEAAALPDDVEVRIVLVYLPIGNFHAPWPTCHPTERQSTSFETGAVGLGRLSPREVCGPGEQQRGKHVASGRRIEHV